MAYTAINIEGGMFPPDLLDEIAQGEGVQGQRSGDFALGANQRVTDEIQASFSDSRVFWDAFQRRLVRASQNSTTITRQNWMVPMMGDVLGFDQLAFQQGSAEAGGQMFNISHRQGAHSNATPIHIVSFESDLDRRNGARRSPHALIQEYLNRSDALWGLVSNGKTIRLLRDSVRLSKPTFIEFDLGGMVESNLYNEFSLFYRLTHVTRFPNDPEKPQECLLEDYYQQGIDQGTRIRDKLRLGVENALRTLGNAFIAHPGSSELRARVDSGELSTQQFYRQLLRLIYRLLFLMVAEERRLLFPGNISGGSRHSIYSDYYSVEQLRSRADRYFHGDDNTDLWQGLNQTFRLFRSDDIATSLGLSALNGELFGERACMDLEGATCTNQELLRAVRELSVFRNDKDIPTRVNYAGLDVEELGSVYEGLLEFQPVLSSSPAAFEFATGSERKETGSYYTPPDLVHELIKSALVPVIDDRVSKAKDKEAKEKALLDLRVCDPASGSGHFMLAAARRIARELAIVREGESEPTPTVYREALRDVIRSCIYAVDKNPLAVDLCKVALWMEGHNPGLPLSFLDNHIKCGDSLVGVLNLGVLDEGIPNDAYKPVEGDDKGAATAYRKQNERERKGQRQLALGELEETVAVGTSIAEDFRALGDIAEGTAQDVNAKEEIYEDLRAEGSDWRKLKVACDLWTSAFFMPLQQEDAFHLEGVPTTGTVRGYLKTGELNPNLVLDVEKTSEAQSFFHWKLEFPDVFEQGGFDVVVGNPPWERIKLQEQEFFAARDGEIASAPNKAARGRLIAALGFNNQALALEFEATKHAAEAQSKFVRESGRFPLSAFGDVNTYALFSEHFRTLVRPVGRAGLIVPTGIATDDSTKTFFGDLVERQSLVSFYDFENREAIFAGVHRSYKFALMTLGGAEAKVVQADFAFFLHQAEQIQDGTRRFFLSKRDFELMNPNTRTCPIFRTGRDAAITRDVFERTPVLIDERAQENPWGVSFMRMLDMSNDSGLFYNSHQLEANGLQLDGNVFSGSGNNYKPLYEGKMVGAFNHRAATVFTNLKNLKRPGQAIESTLAQYVDASYVPTPQYWVDEPEVSARCDYIPQRQWHLAYKSVTSPTNHRTVIASFLPPYGVAHSMNLLVVGAGFLEYAGCLAANLNAFALDYVARQKVGGLNLSNFVVKQFPVQPPHVYATSPDWLNSGPLSRWILDRVLELTFTAWDMRQFAINEGYDGPPFVWDANRRLILFCELDAAFFHLYSLGRTDVDYIMDTFPVLKHADERDHGEYRTKRVILEIYDEMAQAIETGQPYQTRLDPPPADPRVAYPQRASA